MADLPRNVFESNRGNFTPFFGSDMFAKIYPANAGINELPLPVPFNLSVTNDNRLAPNIYVAWSLTLGNPAINLRLNFFKNNSLIVSYRVRPTGNYGPVYMDTEYTMGAGFTNDVQPIGEAPSVLFHFVFDEGGGTLDFNDIIAFPFKFSFDWDKVTFSGAYYLAPTNESLVSLGLAVFTL